MKVIIVEDELAASDNLIYMLQQLDSDVEIVKVIETVKAAVNYFGNDVEADVVLMDIHLADGISFEIFEQVTLNIPIIFTTAYDQYAVKAFKVNSLDYLLKPIDQNELEEALNKVKPQNNSSIDLDKQLEGLLAMVKQAKPSFKSTYLVQKRDELIPLKTSDIALFYIETGIVKAITNQNQSFIIDKKLEDIEEELDPEIFYRANRQYILSKTAIANLKFYFNGKLIVQTNPPAPERIVVSKAKATAFKRWLDS